MSRDFYIAPAEIGTSGTGLARRNPIAGFTDVNSNAIGAAPGDRLILLPGTYKSNLIVPTDGLTIIGDGNEGQIIFDNFVDITTTGTFNASYVESQIGPWVLVDAAKKIYKKGCFSSHICLIDGMLMPLMSTTDAANSEATIIATLAEGECTFRTATTNSIGKTLYVRLRPGDIINQTPIELAGGRLPLNDYHGWIQAISKQDLQIQGAISSRGAVSVGTNIRTLYLEDVNGFRQDAPIYTEWSGFSIEIVAGDDVEVKVNATKGSIGAAVRIAGYSDKTGAYYNGGTITVTDSYAANCGNIVYYDGSKLIFTDQDGLCGVGYNAPSGGNAHINHVIIEDSVSYQCGPRYETAPAFVSAPYPDRGSSVFVGSGVYFQVGKVTIRRNKSEEDNLQAYSVRSLANFYIEDSIQITDNLIKNVKKTPITEFSGYVGNIHINLISVNQPSIDLNISNNTIDGGKNSVASIYASFELNAHDSNIIIKNNIIQNNIVEPGAAGVNAGFVRLYALNNGSSAGQALTGNIDIDNNIFSAATNVYGKNAASSYADFAAWQAAGFDANGQNGTVTIESDGSLTAGTANPFGTGVKYWGDGPRPTSYNGEPRPDIAVDCGHKQSTSHPFHPTNLR